MSKENAIKQEIIWNGMRIQLFEGKKFTDIPYNSESTIIAIDVNDKLIWKAEPPIPNRQQYFDISIDSERNVLVANTGSGYRHLINLENGKVIDHFLIK